ncbi:DUF3298 and DUF4163 domain-containing protein [Chitinophaga sp.]|uniref:DUF3298 and DUF4163 domain-containing protein n=1 Tax=Chitinophaga sp. TaxID=1869181 RepID=UPI0026144700|nr:DUF3298 and DUF4163 domain-containing protein [uncultured Chitinophaga sp.]
MRMLIWMLTALAPLCACQPGHRKSAATGDSTTAAIQAAPVPVAPSFYMQLTGNLAGQPVTMQLVKYAPGKYEGWYVYDKRGEPIGITLSRETADSLFFAEYAGVKNENLFSGVFNGGQFHGVWTGNDDTFGFELEKDMDSVITFVAFMFEDSAKLRPNDPASPVARSSAAMVWPLGGADQDLIGFLRKSMQPEIKPGDMPVQRLKSSVLSYLSAYQDNAKITDSSDLEFGPGASWNWESHATESVVWNKYPYLAIGKMEYEYSGGAHGNYGTTFEAYDLAAKKKLKVTDVFKTGYKPVVGAALEKSYRKQFRVPAGEPLDKGFLFNRHIEPNDNFYLTDKGAVFSFVPYEIAAYAAGQITLFVPWNEIRSVVQPAYLPTKP